MKRSFTHVLATKLNSGLMSYIYKIPFVRVNMVTSMTAKNLNLAVIRKQQFIFCDRVAIAYFTAELEEAIHIVKALWTGAETNFEGTYYTLTKALNEPKPVQKPHPPILVGGHGETHLLRAAARYGDICNIGFEMSLDDHRAAAVWEDDALPDHIPRACLR